MPQNLSSNEQLHFSVEAERAVLGGIMLKNDAWDLVAGVVLEEDFYKKEHRLIFKTIKNLQDVGKPVDLLTVQETLEGNGDLPKLLNLGGKSYLTQLAKDTPGAANIESYAEQIKERSNLRRLITTVDQIAQNARESDSSSSDQIIDHAEESILSLRDDAKRSSGPKGISGELLSQVYSNIQEANLSDNPLVGISTGFTDIDKITLGFQKSDLIIIAGRPSMGKTALALNIAENVVRKTEQTVLIFSMEMSAEQVVRRFIGSIAKIDLQNLMRGKLGDNDWEGIDNALSFLSSKNILLDDTPALSPTELRSRARRVKRENKDLAMIIVDYIGLMQVHGRSDNRVQEISEISRSLKALAKELDVPIVALSQLNRAVESRPNKRPILADLRDSGAIEQDADVIAFLYRHWQYDKSDSNIKEQAEINIAKQRNGPTGTKKLHFREEIAKFDNLDWKDIYPPQDYEDREEN
jgi:replicative DNA helicase